MAHTYTKSYLKAIDIIITIVIRINMSNKMTIMVIIHNTYYTADINIYRPMHHINSYFKLNKRHILIYYIYFNHITCFSRFRLSSPI